MLPTMVATLLNDLLSRASKNVQIALLTLTKDLSGPTDMIRVWTRNIAMWKIPMAEEKKLEAMPMTIFLETELAQRKSQVICVFQDILYMALTWVHCVVGEIKTDTIFFNHLTPLSATCLLFRLCDRTKRGVQFGKQWLYTNIKVQHNPTGHRCPKQESYVPRNLCHLAVLRIIMCQSALFYSLRKKRLLKIFKVISTRENV